MNFEGTGPDPAGFNKSVAVLVDAMHVTWEEVEVESLVLNKGTAREELELPTGNEAPHALVVVVVVVLAVEVLAAVDEVVLAVVDEVVLAVAVLAVVDEVVLAVAVLAAVDEVVLAVVDEVVLAVAVLAVVDEVVLAVEVLAAVDEVVLAVEVLAAVDEVVLAVEVLAVVEETDEEAEDDLSAAASCHNFCFLSAAFVCQPHEQGRSFPRPSVVKNDPLMRAFWHFLIDAIAARTSLFDGFWPLPRKVSVQPIARSMSLSA